MKLDLESINYRRLITNRKYLLVMIVLSLFGLFLIGFSIMPQVGKILDIQSDITKQGKDLRKLQVKLQSLEDAQTLSLVSNAGLIDRALPSYKPLLELMAGVNQMALQSGVGIQDIRLTPGIISPEEEQETVAKVKKDSTDLGGYKSLSVDLTVAGTMAQINSFLSQLERVSPLINVNKIALTEKRGMKDDFLNSSFEAELKIVTYYFTKSVSAAVSDPLPEASNREMELIEEISKYYVADPNRQLNIQGGGSINLFGFDKEYSVEAID